MYDLPITRLICILAIASSLILLVRDSDRFVVGAATTARNIGAPPWIIGLTIVGFGSSAPELLVSGVAIWQGNAGLGIGNAPGVLLIYLTATGTLRISGAMNEQFSVRNVKCGGCVNAIQDGLKELQGVASIEVSIGDGTVRVTGENLDRAALAEKLTELGYPEVTEQEG